MRNLLEARAVLEGHGGNDASGEANGKADEVELAEEEEAKR